MTALSAGELYASGLIGDAPDLMIREQDGDLTPLPLSTYLGPLGRADHDVLARAVAPVLDVGCGPGRHVLALARRGVLAVGVDVSPVAVRVARDRGATVIEASVFDGVPGAGSWGSALLLDGNIGIGGCPSTLLARIATLLTPGGPILVEIEGPGTTPRTGRVRLESAGLVSDWFHWARVGVETVASHAAVAGLRTHTTWQVDGRWFVCVGR